MNKELETFFVKTTFGEIFECCGEEIKSDGVGWHEGLFYKIKGPKFSGYSLDAELVVKVAKTREELL